MKEIEQFMFWNSGTQLVYSPRSTKSTYLFGSDPVSQNLSDPTEGDDKHDRRESEKDKKDRKYKKPDLQIYRPGMGRFSTKKPQEKKEDEVKENDQKWNKIRI